MLANKEKRADNTSMRGQKNESNPLYGDKPASPRSERYALIVNQGGSASTQFYPDIRAALSGAKRVFLEIARSPHLKLQPKESPEAVRLKCVERIQALDAFLTMEEQELEQAKVYSLLKVLDVGQHYSVQLRHR
jgi:hypothetical protein